MKKRTRKVRRGKRTVRVATKTVACPDCGKRMKNVPGNIFFRILCDSCAKNHGPGI